MEGNTLSRELLSDLSNAGASDLFLDYIEETDRSYSAHAEVTTGPFDIETLADNPNLGGGFFAALWEGKAQSAYGRADSKNRPVVTRIADVDEY